MNDRRSVLFIMKIVHNSTTNEINTVDLEYDVAAGGPFTVQYIISLLQSSLLLQKVLPLEPDDMKALGFFAIL